MELLSHRNQELIFLFVWGFCGVFVGFLDLFVCLFCLSVVSPSVWLWGQGCSDLKQFHLLQLYLLPGLRKWWGGGEASLWEGADVWGAL